MSDSTSTSSSSAEGRIPKRTVPNADVPEKIVLCVDRLEESDGCFAACKRAVAAFVHSKRAIDAGSSSFALVLFGGAGEPELACEFVDDARDVLAALEAASPERSSTASEADGEEPEEAEAKKLDLMRVLDFACESVDLPELRRDYKLKPPPFAARALLFYNRQAPPAEVERTPLFEALSKHPYFALDALYTHAPVSEGDSEEGQGAAEEHAKAFDRLQALDNGHSYMFAAPRSSRKMYECAAKLLAHPLQRPPQRDARYNFVI